ncbi:DCN1-like protein 3 [Varanus komodoensis]|uniref:DCN1-like protein n=1 Tax=Varanus komodoensis TaxID=61221 RepID=A0A8D2IYA0_VARKO|nr:DCN1-like protein 3 [Varanus komodoensis]XP_044289779.1 DCN1-like protein 3 [Varanus komodoensis]XP_044289780.1 DCN1-like protein 3 [Varanus komodoensis]XP_044289781.1 DCN1-like protein 3 [Varanus komodoensis]XP_044289782.1 DCN1-like protein 3 [Varanus komodoensis]XP_044289783.1 DCN1-like protein 3 [Varanus komodoensis]
MGQCVTKCKNPSSTLGSKNGDRESGGKTHGKRSGIQKEEHSTVGGKSSGDILVNGTKKMEAAVECGQPPGSSGDSKKEPASATEESSLHRTEELFRRYKDEREDAILEEGMERFCNDLCVDPTEFKVLVLAWKFQAATMCKFTRTEFFEGCKAINADSIDGICARFPSLLNEAKQEDKFKDLYRFTFQFGLDSEEGQRSLHREIAIALWKLVFTQNKPPILDQWLHFLNENPSGIKGISRDTWNMFLNFTQVIGPDLSNYSEDEAWPSLFDTFVEWEMEQRKRDEETKHAAASQTTSLCIDHHP